MAPRARHRHLARLRCCCLGAGLASALLRPLASAVLPVSSFEGEWYGPGVQRGRVLRRLVQTHDVRLARRAPADDAVLTATKLLGDWERGDVGARGELLWRLRAAVPGLGVGGPAVPAELQLSLDSEGRPRLVPAELSAVSKDELVLAVQGKSATYHRCGAVGLERAFRAEAPAAEQGPAADLRRVLFDYAGPRRSPALLPSATPAVEVSHIWRARGAVVVAALPAARGHRGALPSAELLKRALQLHDGVAPAVQRPPRLVLLWPGVPGEAATTEALARAKEALGPRAEVYGDLGGRVLARLSALTGAVAPDALVLAVAPSGAWRWLRAGDCALDAGAWQSFQEGARPLLQKR